MTKEERRRQVIDDHCSEILRNKQEIENDAEEYREMYLSIPDTRPPCIGCPDFVIYYCAEEDFVCANYEIHMDIKKEK